jgi:hypothetical protein
MNTATKKDISKNLEDSTKERFANELDWNNFLGNNGIEIVEQKDLIQIVNNKNVYVCVDPSDSTRYLKMSEEFAEKFADNPYFDKPVTEDILENIKNSLNENENNLLKEINAWIGSSKEVKVNLPIEISCYWDGENQENMTVSEWGNHIKYEIDWNLVKKLEEEVLTQCKKKVGEYENLVAELAKKFKVNNADLFDVLY